MTMTASRGAEHTTGRGVGAPMTPETAIAAVLLYRIATYYLPPAWGFPAMLWLQRHRYL